MTNHSPDQNRQFLTTLANLGIASHRLDRIRDAARLHRKQLISTSELYAVIEADDDQEPTAGAGQADQPPTTEAQAAIDRVRALHRKATHGTTCVYCAHGQRLGYDTTWPCDTIRALDGDGEPAAAAQPDATTLAAIFEGFGRLLATSSRDWGQYAPDAWLYAVILGWDCEEDVHDETCTHGAMEEMQERHGWDDGTVAKARRYRAAVRALTAPAAGARQDGAQR